MTKRKIAAPPRQFWTAEEDARLRAAWFDVDGKLYRLKGKA